MCSITSVPPVQARMAFDASNSSYGDVEPYIHQSAVKMSSKTKTHTRKMSRSVDPVTGIQNNKTHKEITQGHLGLIPSASYCKNSPQHKVRKYISPDVSFETPTKGSVTSSIRSPCRNSLVSPPRHSKHHKSSPRMQLTTDTDELLRKVSIQLMRAQKGEASKKCDITKNSDTSKCGSDGQRSANLSSIESPISPSETFPTSDDCGEFSGDSTPDPQISSSCRAIDESQLRMACEQIIEQQRKMWIAFKNAKRNGHHSLSRKALDKESGDLKESQLSILDTVNTHCNNTHCNSEAISIKTCHSTENEVTSSEQFDSGHGSSEEHEIGSKTELFAAVGSSGVSLPIGRPHYRYHIRRQKAYLLGTKSLNSNSISSLSETLTKTALDQCVPLMTTEADSKPLSHTRKNSKSPTSKIKSLAESPPLSPSQLTSYLSSHTCSPSNSSSPFSCSPSNSSSPSLSSSILNIQEIAENNSTLSTFKDVSPSKRRPNECSASPLQTPSTKFALEQGNNTADTSTTLSLSTSSPNPSFSNSKQKNSSFKKENGKTSAKLYPTVSRGCISCAFISNACSRISQIRRTISGKTSSMFPPGRFFGNK